MTSRDKKLITALILITIFILGYYFLYKPIISKKEVIEGEIAAYNTELIALRNHYAKIASYEKEMQQADEEIGQIQRNLPSSLNQEQAFKLLFAIEQSFEDIQFTNIAFSPITTVTYSGEGEALSETPEEGDVSEELALEPTPILRSIVQTITTDTELSYADLKRFLQFIYDYEDRIVLNNLNMTLNEENGTINVSLAINMYGLEGEGRPVEPIKFDEIPIGKPIPFNSPNVIWAEKTEKDHPSDDKEDLFIWLKPLQADGYAQVIGLTGDPQQNSYVNAEEADQVRALLRIYVEDGQYYANYDINGLYKERQVFDVGSALELALYSSDRLDTADQAAMYLTVINQTELPLYINKVEEDTANPRLFINISEGEVIEN